MQKPKGLICYVITAVSHAVRWCVRHCVHIAYEIRCVKAKPNWHRWRAPQAG